MKNIYNTLKMIVHKILNGALESRKANDGMGISEVANGNVVFVTDGKGISKYSETAWQILTAYYKPLGGLKGYRSHDDFVDRGHAMKLVFMDGQIIACATYRKVESSYKMVAIGCVQNSNGKATLESIVKDDIEKMGLHYFTEVSGAIEHFSKSTDATLCQTY
jgi:hypothetical protein